MALVSQINITTISNHVVIMGIRSLHLSSPYISSLFLLHSFTRSTLSIWHKVLIKNVYPPCLRKDFVECPSRVSITILNRKYN